MQTTDFFSAYSITIFPLSRAESKQGYLGQAQGNLHCVYLEYQLSLALLKITLSVGQPVYGQLPMMEKVSKHNPDCRSSFYLQSSFYPGARGDSHLKRTRVIKKILKKTPQRYRQVCIQLKQHFTHYVVSPIMIYFFWLNTLKGTTKAPGVDLLDTKTILGSAKHPVVLYRSHSPLPPPLNVIPSLQSTVSSLGATMTNNFQR